jgi:hypothetical protein
MALDTRSSTSSTTPVIDTPATQPSRRHALVVAAISIGVVAAAITGGVLVGNHLTGAPSLVGKPVVFPQDWQQYRAGERTTTTPVAPGAEHQAFRAGERSTSVSTPLMGTGYQAFRAGEHTSGVAVIHPSDWLSYRAGEH